jgi:predicted TPR repeat methyltransferase
MPPRPRTPADGQLPTTLNALLNQAETAYAAGKFALVARHGQAILQRDPHHPGALHLLGRMAIDTGAFEIAEGLLQRAAKARPRATAIRVDLGRALQAGAKSEAAILVLQQAIAAEPRNIAGLAALADAQLDTGHADDALATFRRILRIKPDHALAAHMVAGLEGGADGEATRAYAATLFDSYVRTFDEHLTGTLEYRVPEHLLAAIEPLHPERFATAIDIGCGTGLVARAFAGRIDHIDGIDIAPKMVEAARDTGRYRNLAAGDAAVLLRDDPGFAGPYDLALAGDVFVYIGDLDPVFAALAPRLAPGALVAFSVEHIETSGMVLRSTGRFAHSQAYVADLAARYGLGVLHSQPAALRKDRNRPIDGRIMVLQRKEGPTT